MRHWTSFAPAYRPRVRSRRLLTFVIAIFVLGIALGAYAYFGPRKEGVVPGPRAELGALPATTDWAREAGDEFAGLSDSARCDFVFAIAALDDEKSHRLLGHALGDPSDAVALAAAHALARSGRLDEVRRFANERAGPRAATLLTTLALLD
jgi:hypothetical protein